MFRFVTILITLAAAAAFAPRSIVRSSSLQMANIVETAVAAGSFKTLVAAVTAAGLAPMLSGGAGSETWHVFAPTDEAFAKLPPGTVDALLKDTEKLKAILGFHCVSEEDQLRGTRVKTLKEITYKNGNSFVTANGKDLQVKTKGADIYVIGSNFAKITTAGIKCDNGFINIIDTVVMPYEGKILSIFDFKI